MWRDGIKGYFSPVSIIYSVYDHVIELSDPIGGEKQTLAIFL